MLDWQDGSEGDLSGVRVHPVINRRETKERDKFSFDLRESLNQMEAERLINWEEQSYPYGPKITEGRAAPVLRGSIKPAQDFHREIEFVSQELGDAGVAQLERIATALWVTLDFSVEHGDRMKRLLELKPHVQLPKAEAAFTRVEEIRIAALNAGFNPVATVPAN